MAKVKVSVSMCRWSILFTCKCGVLVSRTGYTVASLAAARELLKRGVCERCAKAAERKL